MKIALLTADIGNPCPNAGDYFITTGIESLLRGHTTVRVALHTSPSAESLALLKQQDLLVICGSNLVGETGTVRSAFRREHFEAIGVPVLPIGLGAQANLDQTPRIDPEGEELLRYWFQSTGPLSARDPWSAAVIESVLGEGAAEITGCPSLLLQRAPLFPTRSYLAFSSGPYFYRSPFLNEPYYEELMGDVFALLRQQGPALFVAQEPSDLRFSRIPPGSATLSAPTFPEAHLRALVSARAVVGFRIHPCMMAASHRIPTFLISLDRRTYELARFLGIPQIALKKAIRASHLWEITKASLQNFDTRLVSARIAGVREGFPRWAAAKGICAETPGEEPVSAPLPVACIADETRLPELLGLLSNLREKHSGSLEVHLLRIGEWTLPLEDLFPSIRFRFYLERDVWTQIEWDRVKGRSVEKRAYSAKPAFMKTILARIPEALFCDVDLYFFRSPKDLLRGESPTLFFPHRNDVAQHDHEHGTINAGLFVARRAAVPFLQWWSEKVVERCEESSGYYYEQKYLDEAAERYPARDHNVGPWNLSRCGVSLDTQLPWQPQTADGPMQSYHANEPDPLGISGFKYLWDHLVLVASNQNALGKHQPFLRHLYHAQRAYWPELKRALFLYETFRYRFNWKWLPLTEGYVLWAVTGAGRGPLKVLSAIYSRVRDLKNGFRETLKRRIVSLWEVGRNIGLNTTEK